jgi:type 2A phosphatase activator TIP41
MTPSTSLNYENTIMASAVKLPIHTLEESPNSRTINIYDWTITAYTHPISNASELDAIQATVGFPLPEMTFGNNALELEHKPSGLKYEFTAVGALKEVKSGPLEDGDGGVKVGYADAWLKSRCVHIDTTISESLIFPIQHRPNV